MFIIEFQAHSTAEDKYTLELAKRYDHAQIYQVKLKTK
jgi:hypothetical protein